MNLFVFCVFIFCLFFVCFLFIFPFFKLGIYFFDWGFLCLKFNFFFNSFLFSFILFLVSVSVFVYSCYYLNGEVNFYYYFFVLLIFVGSMFSLIFSNSVFCMMLSWDLLGISSFFLVLFYNNWDSCSGSMNTVLTNRLGDFFMFVFFSMSFFSSFYFSGFSYFSYYLAVFLILTAFTKSAQFPFSGWLPKAMSAPTPVSSLVHSSTLVTAGLVLLMNFNCLVFSKSLMSVVLIVGVFTMFFSSVSALFEEDLKKVVALSTLSQMGFSMVTLGLGLNFVCFIHLLSHALFKSCLFMQVGYIIHCSFGQQDGRNYNGVGNLPYYIQVQMLVTLFCLCGLVFSSGSVSKDIILEMFFSNNFMVFFSVLFFVSVFLTFAYSYRLWKSIFSVFNSVFMHYSNNFLMNFLSLFLVFFSIVFIWWLNFNLLSLPSLFLYLDFYCPLLFFFFSFFVLVVGLKFVFKELSYKFVGDYIPLLSIRFLVNNKYFDLFLNFVGFKGFSFFSFSGFLSLSYMKSLDFSSIVFVIFLLFMIF
uniref:NADH:ubiquinone reductase (H(+)-translocating) n=1 Tax=Parastrongyloides trichosuri TaxID=131310 RepID=A0A0S3M445_PARTI|nr:NADH dehydrogenase subunit 5 [Parastrongyloides trichosuri]BAT21174.1 NADH dehydrogenase subunit 5 [Parastrongyloides trichosuri]